MIITRTANFEPVYCFESGLGFERGVWYAVIGNNNGMHVFRTNKDGDPYELLCHHFDGELRPADDELGDSPAFIHFPDV